MLLRLRTWALYSLTMSFLSNTWVTKLILSITWAQRFAPPCYAVSDGTPLANVLESKFHEERHHICLSPHCVFSALHDTEHRRCSVTICWLSQSVSQRIGHCLEEEPTCAACFLSLHLKIQAVVTPDMSSTFMSLYSGCIVLSTAILSSLFEMAKFYFS